MIIRLLGENVCKVCERTVSVVAGGRMLFVRHVARVVLFIDGAVHDGRLFLAFHQRNKHEDTYNAAHGHNKAEYAAENYL